MEGSLEGVRHFYYLLPKGRALVGGWLLPLGSPRGLCPRVEGLLHRFYRWENRGLGSVTKGPQLENSLVGDRALTSDADIGGALAYSRMPPAELFRSCPVLAHRAPVSLRVTLCLTASETSPVQAWYEMVFWVPTFFLSFFIFKDFVPALVLFLSGFLECRIVAVGGGDFHVFPSPSAEPFCPPLGWEWGLWLASCLLPFSCCWD